MKLELKETSVTRVRQSSFGKARMSERGKALSREQASKAANRTRIIWDGGDSVRR